MYTLTTASFICATLKSARLSMVIDQSFSDNSRYMYSTSSLIRWLMQHEMTAVCQILERHRTISQRTSSQRYSENRNSRVVFTTSLKEVSVTYVLRHFSYFAVWSHYKTTISINYKQLNIHSNQWIKFWSNLILFSSDSVIWSQVSIWQWNCHFKFDDSTTHDER